MGQTIRSFTREIEQSEDPKKDETIERLTLIEQMLASKLKTKTNEMRAAATEDVSFPVAAVVNKLEKYLIAVENLSVEEIERCVNEVFRGQFLGGFINVASADIKELFENTSTAELERMACHVVFADNSFLRVDYYLCKYTFSSKGFKEKFKNAVCYAVQVGVLDLQKADLDLVKQELHKTVTTRNNDDTKQTQSLYHEVLYAADLYKRITRLQIVAGCKMNESAKFAWENILHYLLADVHQNRRTPTPSWRVPESLPYKFQDIKRSEEEKLARKRQTEQTVRNRQGSSMEGREIKRRSQQMSSNIRRKKFNLFEFYFLKFLFKKPFNSPMGFQS